MLRVRHIIITIVFSFSFVLSCALSLFLITWKRKWQKWALHLGGLPAVAGTKIQGWECWRSCQSTDVLWTCGPLNVEGRERTLGIMGRKADAQPKFWTGWGGRNQDTRDMTELKVGDAQLSRQVPWKAIGSLDHLWLWAGPGSSSFSLSRVEEGRELPARSSLDVKVVFLLTAFEAELVLGHMGLDLGNLVSYDFISYLVILNTSLWKCKANCLFFPANIIKRGRMKRPTDGSCYALPKQGIRIWSKSQ